MQHRKQLHTQKFRQLRTVERLSLETHAIYSEARKSVRVKTENPTVSLYLFKIQSSLLRPFYA